MRGQITGTVDALGTGVRPDWSMSIRDLHGDRVAYARQHFVVGSADQDMRDAWLVISLYFLQNSYFNGLG